MSKSIRQIYSELLRIIRIPFTLLKFVLDFIFFCLKLPVKAPFFLCKLAVDVWDYFHLDDIDVDDLLLNNKLVEKKEREIQVYIVVFGLFESNFHHPDVQLRLDTTFVLFLCCALLYYIFVSRCFADSILTFLRIIGYIIGTMCSLIIIQYLYGLGFWAMVFIIASFTVLIGLALDVKRGYNIQLS